MNPTLKAVLARFEGNAVEAYHYCVDIAASQPHLFEEYTTLAEKLIGEKHDDL